jgi:hypothetical protein
MPDAKPAHRAWFRSIKNHDEVYPLDEVVYTARDGSLLEVAHDMAELKKTPAAEWKRKFRERAHSSQWPYGSGVWGKKEWVLPNVDNEHVVSMYEGNTEPVLGVALRPPARPRRALDQAVRQHAHRARSRTSA